MSRVSKKLHVAVEIAQELQAEMLALGKHSATIEDDPAPITEGEELAMSSTMTFTKSLEPWEQCPDVWKTKSAYFTWIRGQMRRAWSRHPVKVSYMQEHRIRVPLGRVTTKNPDGLVWGCKCEHCNQLFKQSECEVDHLNEAGSFKDWEDFEQWMRRLMHINWDSIAILCKTCHRIKSYAARMGISFEEAKLEKEAIAFSKLSVKLQNGILIKCMSEGFVHVATNAKDRRAAYKKYLQEKL